jgi:hypothetical protein
MSRRLNCGKPSSGCLSKRSTGPTLGDRIVSVQCFVHSSSADFQHQMRTPRGPSQDWGWSGRDHRFQELVIGWVKSPSGAERAVVNGAANLK